MNMSIFDEIDAWERSLGRNLFEALLNTPNPVILDYGCGAGNYTFAAAYTFDPDCLVYAVDVNQQALDFIAEKARKEDLPSVKTAKGRDDYRQDFEDDTFDLVFYSDMFHGFRNLRNLTQLLRFLILQGKNLKHARLPDITIVNKL